MDEDLLANEDGNNLPQKEVVPQPVPKHIKILAGAMILILGVAIGTAGHAIYTEEPLPTAETLQATANMLSRMNITANPCSEMYTYSCGGYVNKHLPFGGANVFHDMQEESTAAAYHAFQEYTDAEPNSVATAFYNHCMGAGPQSRTNCTVDGEPGHALMKALWMHGYPVQGLFVDRSVSPYEPNTRTFSIFLSTYTPGDVKRPTMIESRTDPCNLFKILELMYDCTICEDYNMLLYGDTDLICTQWQAADADAVNVSLASQSSATDDCVSEMRKRYSVQTCIRHTSMFFPTVSKAYAGATLWEFDSTEHLFKLIQQTLAAIVAPLGEKVVTKVQDVKLHAQWSADNLNPGPSRTVLYSAQSYASLFLKLLYSKNAESLRGRTMVSPAWHINSYSINAYYQPSENSIYLPNAMQVLARGMQFPGALAFVLAHELSHSIDPSSISYNERGIYDTLLSKDGESYYNRFLGCIRTNRPKQLSEDFADRVAAQIVATITPNDTGVLHLLNSEFTFKQQIVLQMSQLWCQAETVERYDDSHSPSRLRVEESMSSLFTHEFKCAEQQTCKLG